MQFFDNKFRQYLRLKVIWLYDKVFVTFTILIKPKRCQLNFYLKMHYTTGIRTRGFFETDSELNYKKLSVLPNLPQKKNQKYIYPSIQRIILSGETKMQNLLTLLLEYSI